LTFEAPDESRFPCLELARQAARLGGTAPAVLNGADEALVTALLDGRIAFIELPRLLAAVLEAHTPAPADSIEAVERADAWARARVGEHLAGGHQVPERGNREAAAPTSTGGRS
jgi:1-deoxy-D-xylulose-5-phosphate reductoisomerase